MNILYAHKIHTPHNYQLRTCLIFGTLLIYPSKCPNNNRVASTKCAACAYFGIGCCGVTIAALRSCSAACNN